MTTRTTGLRKGLTLARGLAGVKAGRWTGRRPAGPLFAFLELNKACNNRCLYCSIWKSPKGAGAGLPTDVVKRTLDDLADTGCLFVDFFGGEPLLRPDLTDLCAHASAQGMHVTVTTNGRLLTREKVVEISEARLDQVLITVAGARPETHDRMVGVQGAFDQLLAGTSALIGEARNTFVGFNTFVSAQNFTELPGVVERAHDLGVPCVRFLPFNASFPFNAFGLDPNSMTVDAASLGAFRVHLRESVRRARHYGMLTNSELFLSGIPGYLQTGNQVPYPCYAGYLFCDIGADGTVYRCFPSRKEMGNVRNDPFPRIWRSPQAREACRPNGLPQCRSCWQSCYVETSVRICVRHLPGLLPSLIREARLFLFRSAPLPGDSGKGGGPHR